MDNKTANFLKRVEDIFGKECDFSNVRFVNQRTTVRFNCFIHGEFEVRPDSLFANLRTGKRLKLCGQCSRAAHEEKRVRESLAQARPDIAAQWHPTKNQELKPEKVSVNSNRKAWFLCKQNPAHVWDSQINNLSRRKKIECPFCIGIRVDQTNSLAALFPALAAEWDSEKNEGLTADQVYAFRTKKKFYWKCPIAKDHSWRATIVSRTKGSPVCPFCSGRKLSTTNSLASVAPEVAATFDPELNGGITPHEIRWTSHKKYTWKCLTDGTHLWKTTVYSRAVQKNGCPFCSGRLATTTNNFELLEPELAKEWHPELNGDLRPSDVTPSSDTKIWWQCTKVSKHVFDAAPHKRRAGRNCPYCSGKRVDDTNNLLAVFPEIAAEWHPGKNGDLLPEQFTAKSGKKVWWQCSKFPSHEWATTIASRTTGSGCPFCRSQTSLPEIRLYTELLTIFADTKSRQQIQGKEADVFIPDLNIAIEYDGAFFHADPIVVRRDKAKAKHFQKNQIELIRVREKPLQKLGKLDIIVSPNELKKTDINQLVSRLASLRPVITEECLRYCSNKKFQGDKLYRELVALLPNPFPEVSLEQVAPSIAAEWDYQKNHPLTPKNFSSGSGQKVWWLCKENPKHSWEAVIASRARSGSGCPYCSNVLVSDENNLATKAPHLLPEFDYEKNQGLQPETVIAGSGKKLWWKCPKGPDHIWQAAPVARIKGVGCPFCANQKVSVTNSLKAHNPAFLKEWHPSKNGLLKPEDIVAGSTKLLWWQCSRGPDHIWRASPLARRKSGCPFCAGLKVSITNNLAIKRPEVAKLWHPSRNRFLRPEDVLPYSTKDVWWQCNVEKRHIWKQTPNSVTKCGFCSGKRVNRSNSISGKNIALAQQWHPTKNGKIKPSEVYFRSRKYFWWQCQIASDHEWRASPQDRDKSSGCPFCSGKRVSSTNSLASLYPKVAKQWHPTRNGDLTPERIHAGSHKEVWFICDFDPSHEWKTALKNRTKKKVPTGCPWCFGRKPKT